MFGRGGVCVTRHDYDRLLNLVDLHANPAASANGQFLKNLRKGLMKARKVDSEKITPDCITMNSTFRLRDIGAPGSMVVTLVFPDEADHARGRISVLSPEGFAALGSRVGDVIRWEGTGGEKFYQVQEIIYQPEAAGDYHL